MLRYAELIGKMTLEEKASLMSGANFWNTKSVDRLGIPSMMLTDGPHGLRKQGGKADHLGLNQSLPATCFPTAAALANSWDVDLLREVGSCLGKEAAAGDVSVLLGPGLNIKRNPLCGRNFEYFSEDPYLSGKLAAAFIQGVQQEGVSACPKHFAVNSQETNRMSVDETVDTRALHEIYLEGFRYAVCEGKADTVMTSYNRVNGTYANEHPYLVREVLQRQWGFDGLVVTDWGGNNDRVAGLIAGNALEMPSTGGVTDAEIVEAVSCGKLDEALLDERVDALLAVVYKTRPAPGKGRRFTEDAHHQAAVEAACRSAVLLKNEGGILPLGTDCGRVAVIGDFAETPRYQGAGSSLINPTRLDDALTALRASGLDLAGFESGFKRLGGRSRALRDKAVALAKRSDVVLLFLGLDESSEAEGLDRKHMRLAENQLALLDALYPANPNIVLVLAGGSPVEMSFTEKVQAILHGYLPGQGGGSALAKIITGAYNPSGKLAESYPLSYDDVPSAPWYPGAEATAEHRESIYVGYRYYDAAKCEVRFPFGHGLSYSKFAYSGLSVSEDGAVTLTVTNTDGPAGEEIVQIYVRPKTSAVFRAEKELKGFAKVRLASGESKEVAIRLADNAFAYYHTGENRWVTEPGRYEVLAAASSRDIRLSVEVEKAGEAVASPYNAAELPAYYAAGARHIPDAEFERLLGRPLPKPDWDAGKALGYGDIIAQAKDAGAFGRCLYRLILAAHKLLFRMGRPIAANNAMFFMSLPFRSVARLSGGRVTMQMLDGILLMVNGRFWKGLAMFLKHRRHKRRLEKAEGNR